MSKADDHSGITRAWHAADVVIHLALLAFAIVGLAGNIKFARQQAIADRKKALNAKVRHALK